MSKDTKADIYGRIDHGNAEEITNDALKDASQFDSNKVQGPVKDSRRVSYPEKE
jgi:hypothetical protein